MIKMLGNVVLKCVRKRIMIKMLGNVVLKCVRKRIMIKMLVKCGFKVC